MAQSMKLKEIRSELNRMTVLVQVLEFELNTQENTLLRNILNNHIKPELSKLRTNDRKERIIRRKNKLNT